MILMKFETVKILLASVSSGIHTMWPNREKCRAWTIAERYVCLVVIIHSTHGGTIWFRTSLLVTAQHSEPYRKIGRMHVLYNFSLVGMVILHLQICLSRFCIASRVMALRRKLFNPPVLELWLSVAHPLQAWTFVFCQLNLSPRDAASDVIVSSAGTRSSSCSARRATSSAKSRSDQMRLHSCLCPATVHCYRDGANWAVAVSNVKLMLQCI